MKSQTWAIVMAGGSGTRLWPASRKRNPKQFLKLFGKKTLIENTIDRVSKVIPKKRIFIITDARQVARVRRTFPKIPAHQIIGEPCAQNTAATIGLGALLIQKKDPNAIMAIFPADHVILNVAEFQKCVLKATSWAKQKGRHVLFGVKPT
ncbi:MAG: NTP transferase domain-containing protein, partial [Candidatus Omnitrophica bacterium]|nr:NTP transferase domain-containing protein [Candidatus Omnitrophota bacterium]